MIRKKFDDYIKTRFSKEKIAEIEKQARLEKELFDSWQQEITKAVDIYMEKNNVGFNDLVKILNVSPTQVSKLKKGQANLTLASMAHIFSTLNQIPRLTFRKK